MGYRIQKIYVGTHQVRPAWGGGRQPWANTLAYYPLTATTTVNDQSWNNYDLTNAGDATFQTVDWVSCLWCDGVEFWNGYVYTQDIPTPTSITINLWAKASNDWAGSYARWLFDTDWDYQPQWNHWIRWELYSWNGTAYIIVWNGGNWTPWSFNQWNTWVNYSVIQSWTLWTITYDGVTNDVKIYVNWTLNSGNIITANIPSGNWLQNFTLGVWWRNASPNRHFKGYISEVILEDQPWSAQEVADYYDATKWNYWIS